MERARSEKEAQEGSLEKVTLWLVTNYEAAGLNVLAMLRGWIYIKYK